MLGLRALAVPGRSRFSGATGDGDGPPAAMRLRPLVSARARWQVGGRIRRGRDRHAPARHAAGCRFLQFSRRLSAACPASCERGGADAMNAVAGTPWCPGAGGRPRRRGSPPPVDPRAPARTPYDAFQAGSSAAESRFARSPPRDTFQEGGMRALCCLSPAAPMHLFDYVGAG